MASSLASWTPFQISEALKRSFPELNSLCDAVVAHGVNGQRLVEISHKELLSLGAPHERLTEIDSFVRNLAAKSSSRTHPIDSANALVRVGELFINDSLPSSNRVTFHLSGFGPFHGVDDNPTQRNMEALPGLLKSSPIESAHVATISIVETSAVGALLALAEMNQTHSKHWPSSKAEKVVFLHFGVHSGATSFRLEHFAYNEANFRVPDERGWSPHQQAILPKRGSASSKLTTTLPVEVFSETMRNKGFPTTVSQDAAFNHSTLLRIMAAIHSLSTSLPTKSSLRRSSSSSFNSSLALLPTISPHNLPSLSIVLLAQTYCTKIIFSHVRDHFGRPDEELPQG